MIILMKPARAYDECLDFKTDVFICLNEGADATYARYGRSTKVNYQEVICLLCAD